MLTDYDIYQPPALPALPPVGNQITDAVFGTVLTLFWRGAVTDSPRALYGAGWKYGAFTYDSKFLKGPAWLYPIDPVTLAGGAPIPIPNPGIGTLVSPSRPVVYITDEKGNLSEWDYSAGQTTQLFNFTPYNPPNATGSGWRIEGAAADDSTILLIFSGAPSRILVWARRPPRVLWIRDPLDAAHYLKPWLDKSGKFCAPMEFDTPFCGIADVASGIEQYWAAGQPDGVAAHNGQLTGALLHFGGIPDPEVANETQILLADLAAGPEFQSATVPGNVFPGPAAYIDGHCNDERWAFAGGCEGDTALWDGKFSHSGQCEVFAFATDGSPKIRRYCHTHAVWSSNDAYWNRVHPAVSPDGSLCAFTSNWTHGAPQPGEPLHVFLFRTGLNAPSYVPRNAPLRQSNMRALRIANDAWAAPNQTRGPIGTQYRGVYNAAKGVWMSECGLPVSFAIASPPGRPQATVAPDGHYAIPAGATDQDVYHVSARVGDRPSDDSQGLVLVGNGPTGDTNHVPVNLIPPIVAPPDTGAEFPQPGIPSVTQLLPGPQAPPQPPQPPATPPPQPLPPPAPLPVPPSDAFTTQETAVLKKLASLLLKLQL